MASLNADMNVKVTFEMAQDAEEFIRQIVRDEIVKALAERDKTRGWRPARPKEHK